MNIQEQRAKVELEIKKLENMGGTAKGRFTNIRNSAFQRFPTLFVLLSSFGLVATFYGFEKVIDQFQYFADNPYMILVMGITVLIFTGALLKKLK